MLGHKDTVDNLLYATSLAENMILLTMDENLKEFLEKKDYETSHLLTHRELLEKTGL